MVLLCHLHSKVVIFLNFPWSCLFYKINTQCTGMYYRPYCNLVICPLLFVWPVMADHWILPNTKDDSLLCNMNICIIRSESFLFSEANKQEMQLILGQLSRESVNAISIYVHSSKTEQCKHYFKYQSGGCKCCVMAAFHCLLGTFSDTCFSLYSYKACRVSWSSWSSLWWINL